MHFLRGLIVLMFTILTVAATKDENPSSSEVVRCKFPAQQIYSHKARKCLSLVNGPCSISSDKLTGCPNLTNTIECIPEAVCQQTGLFGYCICKPGLVDTADRKCALMYGQSCDISSEVQCDEHTLLGCIEGRCDCANPMHEFNGYSGLCVGKVGAFCKHLTREQERNYVPNHDYVICGYGAFCYTSVGVGIVEQFSFTPRIEFVEKRFGNGVCICDGMSNYRETENRTCEYTRSIYESFHEKKSEDGSSFSGTATPNLILLILLIVAIMMVLICFFYITFRLFHDDL